MYAIGSACACCIVAYASVSQLVPASALGKYICERSSVIVSSLCGLDSWSSLMQVTLQKAKLKKEGGDSNGRGGRPVTWYGGGGMNPQ